MTSTKPTPGPTSAATAATQRQKIERLQRINAELLEVLQDIVEFDCGGVVLPHSLHHRADVAIKLAKAEDA